MRRAVWAIAAFSLTVPAYAQEEVEHPRSYYPTLTTADLAVCRPQFAALQADVVEHFRQSAYRYRPGGEHPYADNVRSYTKAMNEIAVKDPIAFYVVGVMGDGEGVGDLNSLNRNWNEELAQRALDWTGAPEPTSTLDYSLSRVQVEVAADKCVAKVWFKKFNAMHASATATRANPAVWSLNESLTPLSIGSSNAPAPPGKDAHIIASNGKSAMTCVKLVRLAKGDSKLTGIGGRVLSNQCADAVEAGWCYSPGDCDTEHGSSWTIPPGRSWPVQSAPAIRWAACHGANTQSFVKGSHGLRYYCTAPK